MIFFAYMNHKYIPNDSIYKYDPVGFDLRQVPPPNTNQPQKIRPDIKGLLTISVT